MTLMRETEVLNKQFHTHQAPPFSDSEPECHVTGNVFNRVRSICSVWASVAILSSVP